MVDDIDTGDEFELDTGKSVELIELEEDTTPTTMIEGAELMLELGVDKVGDRDGMIDTLEELNMGLKEELDEIKLGVTVQLVIV